MGAEHGQNKRYIVDWKLTRPRQTAIIKNLRRSRVSSSFSNIAAASSPTTATDPPRLGIGLGPALRSISINKTLIPSWSSIHVTTRSISGPVANPGSPRRASAAMSMARRSLDNTISNASAIGDCVSTARRTSLSRPRVLAA